MRELEERLILWQMVRECLPYARKALLAGGVSLPDQEAFWGCYRELSDHCDPDECDLYSPSGIGTIVEGLSAEVMELRETDSRK